MLFFSETTRDGAENRRRRRLFKGVACITATTLVWLSGPYDALACLTFDKLHPRPKAYSLLKEGLTQTPDAALQTKIDTKETEEKAKLQPDFRPLNAAEKKGLAGRGPGRGKYLSGAPMPWHRAFRDVNLVTGNLFKSFTDIQMAPAKGAGLVLQRTYSSQDEREGPFGVGWTHAYDIRMEEAPGETDAATGDEIVPRTDFFGGKHKYVRDADGLYTPPPYLFDEMSSAYNLALTSGPPASDEDIDKGMDGTIKHFVKIGTKADGTNVRACDKITDRHGNITTLAYGAAVTMADGSSVKLLQSVTDPSGRILNFTWVNKGTTTPHWRITQVQATDGVNLTYKVTYDYEATSGRFELWNVHLDSGSGNLDRVTTYTYTSSGTESDLLASISDPLGHQVSFGYGASSGYYGKIYVSSVTEPAGVTTGGTQRTLTWTFSGSGSVTGSNGLTASIAIDSQGRTTQVSSGSGYYGQYLVEYQSNTNNNVTVVRKVIGSVSFAQITKMTYGFFGNVLTQRFYQDDSTPFPGVVTTTYYNASKFFQKASVTDANGKTTKFDYYDKYDSDVTTGNVGETRFVQDADFATTGKQYTYDYNSVGQKIKEINLNGVTTNYTYGGTSDSWGNLTKVVQDAGTGNNPQGVPYLNRATTMTYDLYGRVLSSTDPKGQTSAFTYNALGQPMDAKFRDAASVLQETVTYGYGTNGRTENVTDNRGMTAMTYEAGSDRVSSVTDPVTGTMSYTYALSGERLTSTTPDSRTTVYSYDAGGGGAETLPNSDLSALTLRLNRITDPDGRQVDMYYRASNTIGVSDSWRWNQTFSAGGSLQSYSETNITYDQTTCTRYWLTQIKNTFTNVSPSTTTTLTQNDYTYNNAGQRTNNALSGTAVGGARTEVYGYDNINRLSNVNYGDGQTQSYSFDAMGNRKKKIDSAAGTELYSYNNANMLLTRGSNNYSNDINGNTQTGGGRANTWDTQSRLTQCVTGTGAGQKTSTFTYGSDGLRRTMNVQTGNGAATAQYSETQYILDGQSVVQEKTRQKSGSGGSWTAWATVNYLMGPSGPMARIPALASDARWYCYDGLGSVLAEVDVNGAVQGTRKYDVYGATRSYTGTPVGRQAFVGQLGHATDDETGLTYMRARYYDNVTGRFISEDSKQDGLNWFGYCSADPVNKMDESGQNEHGVASLIAYAMGLIARLARGEIAPDLLRKLNGILSALLKISRKETIEGGMEMLEAEGWLEASAFTPEESAAIIEENLAEIQQGMGAKKMAWGISARCAAYQVVLAMELLTSQNSEAWNGL